MIAVACFEPSTFYSINVFTLRLIARGVIIFLSAYICSILRLGKKLIPAKTSFVESPASLSGTVAACLPPIAVYVL